MFSSLPKVVIIAALVGLFSFGGYWLWQRQPKPQHIEPQAEVVKLKESAKEEAPSIKPADFSVLKDGKIKLEGKTSANAIVVIYSNDVSLVSTSSDNGSFQKDLILPKGLNLLEIVSYSKDLNETDRKSLTYWVSEKEKSLTVYAGPVKTIFDTLLTVSASSEKKIRFLPSTQISEPVISDKEKETPDSTTSAISRVRIGDYLIALGELDGEKVLTASSAQIIRDDKPQNSELVFGGKVLTAVKRSSFNAKNSKEDKIIEFTVGRKSEIKNGDKEGENKDIVKDKTLIIVYHASEDQKIVDLVYLLP